MKDDSNRSLRRVNRKGRGAADRTDIKFLAKLPVFNADGTVK